MNAIYSAQMARVAKLADARDLKSRVSKETYRFDSGPGHHPFNQLQTYAVAVPRTLPCFSASSGASLETTKRSTASA